MYGQTKYEKAVISRVSKEEFIITVEEGRHDLKVETYNISIGSRGKENEAKARKWF